MAKLPANLPAKSLTKGEPVIYKGKYYGVVIADALSPGGIQGHVAVQFFIGQQQVHPETTHVHSIVRVEAYWIQIALLLSIRDQITIRDPEEVWQIAGVAEAAVRLHYHIT